MGLHHTTIPSLPPPLYVPSAASPRRPGRTGRPWLTRSVPTTLPTRPISVALHRPVEGGIPLEGGEEGGGGWKAPLFGVRHANVGSPSPRCLLAMLNIQSKGCFFCISADLALLMTKSLGVR